MLKTTLEQIRCVQSSCDGQLIFGGQKNQAETLSCIVCKFEYPILSGVAILVLDPDEYILEHVKGISKWVSLDQIPRHLRRDYSRIQKSIQREHIEDDLESDRVAALYFMNHYLDAVEAAQGVESEVIRQCILENWNQGPMSWVGRELSPIKNQTVVEMGCGVGGLARWIAGTVRRYLGVDSSFTSVALARHLWCDTVRGLAIQGVPADLLQGPLSREISISRLKLKLPKIESIDFVVGDLENPPTRPNVFDGSIVLNAIDMMKDPAQLPKIQKRQIHPEGWAIQGSPYVWHEGVLADLRKQWSAKNLTIDDSAQWVASLYRQSGFQIVSEQRQVPWIFFKHLRQVEIYSAHLFLAR